MFQSWLIANPWDLVDEGPDGTLDLLRGHFGVTGIAVWAVGPPVLQLRVRPIHPRFFRSDGGVHFQAEASHYTSSRCKPATADWIKSRNPLQGIVAGCADRDLGCRLVVSASRAGRTAERHPAFATKNVLGLESRQAICPLNPDVQAWLTGLMVDLSTHYRPDAVVLCDVGCAWSDVSNAGMESVGSQAPLLGRLLGHLLKTCMCESCRQGAAKAGIDVEAVEGVLIDEIDRAVCGDHDGRELPSGDAAHPDALAAYLTWQSEALAVLVNELCRVATCEILQMEDHRVRYGSAQRLGSAAGGPRVIRRGKNDRETPKAPTAEAGREEVYIALSEERLLEGSSLVHEVTSLAERGFAGVMLDHFGAIRRDRDSAVRQAIRFARRSTGS